VGATFPSLPIESGYRSRKGHPVNASLRRFLASVVLAAATCGTLAAVLFARAGVTLNEDGARGPFVVAGVALCIVAFAIAVGSVAWIVSRVADSVWPAAAAAFVLIINPNLLYLQSRPAIEPLVLGTTLLAVAMLVEWCARPDTAGLDVHTTGTAGLKARTPGTGLAFAVACLTGYQAWSVTGAALAGAVLARRQERARLSEAIRDVAPMAIYPLLAICVFFLVRRIVVGQWFSIGSSVAEDAALGQPLTAANQILTGVRALGGTLTTVIALVGLIGLLARGVFTPSDAIALVALAPTAAAVVPWVALFEGHPQRVRVMVPLLAAQAIGAGAAAARWGRAAPVAAVVLMIIAGLEIAPMFGAVPMFGLAP
jgi:hypothetical protein